MIYKEPSRLKRDGSLFLRTLEISTHTQVNFQHYIFGMPITIHYRVYL